MIPLSHYLILSSVLFFIGLLGVLTKRNPVIMFMCIEMMLNAVNLSFVAFTRYKPWESLGFSMIPIEQDNGQIFVLFIMTVAAAEVAVGLGLVMAIFRKKQIVTTDDQTLTSLKG